jgi:hypothetical protein
MISLQDILQIDGGSSYIVHRYPNAERAMRDKRHKFKLREEKTASAAAYEKDGIWYVTDFGGDGKRMNAVDVCMFEDGVDFKEAIQRLAGFYQLEGGGHTSVKPDFDKWPAKPDEAEGAVSTEVKEMEIHEMLTLFSKYAWKALGKTDEDRIKQGIALCTSYHFKALASFSHTKSGTTYKYSSTKDFPIFMIDEGTWKKIYKPKDQKKYRFFSTGTKPKDFIHGLERLTKYVADQRAKDLNEVDEDDEDAETKRVNSFKVTEVILATGGSDALNIAAMGYHAVWMNSETATLSDYTYSKVLQEKAWEVYNCPDIDATGIEKAHELAMQFLDLKTIQLPPHLLLRKDKNGNACKDVRDFLNYYKRFDFELLVDTALPYQFWEATVKKKGDKVLKRKGKPVMSYDFKNLRLYNFLYNNGFARLTSEKEKEGYQFVHVDGYVVKSVLGSQMKDFVHKFLGERYQPEELRDIVYRSPNLNDASLANVPYRELDFKPYGSDFHYLFFQQYNAYKQQNDCVAWKITAEGITEEKGDVGKYIWEQKVIKAKPEILGKMFNVFELPSGEHDVEILNDSSKILRFFLQTCRVHWRVELEERLGICSRLKTRQQRDEYAIKYELSDEDKERIFDPKNTEKSEFETKYREKYKFSLDGYLLTEAERFEQRRHFANRLYVLGYNLHRYKNPSKTWGTYVMDGRIASEGASQGGTGKSLFAKALQPMNLIMVTLSGRNAKLTENPHALERVDFSTDIVNVDDICDYFNFGYFYDGLTGDLPVNPKQKLSFSIPYADSPKFIFSSNFGDRNTDGSDLRRKIYTVYSDYYHEKNDNSDYLETRKPDEEFGGNLFFEWSTAEWDMYYNFMAQCLSFYLSAPKKIAPPLNNIQKRNLISEMTEQFKAWADVYFFPEGEMVNTWIVKKDAFDHFLRETNTRTHSAQLWKNKLKAYCKYMQYDFNPDEQGTNIRKIETRDIHGNPKSTSAEHIYIATDSSPLTEMKQDISTTTAPFGSAQGANNKKDEDDPF